MRTYRVSVILRGDDGARRTETRTIAASNLADAKAKAHRRFGQKRVQTVAPAKREEQEETSLAIDLKDHSNNKPKSKKRSFEPATNMCPACEGKGGACERCNGAGEVHESHKPTFIEFLVEADEVRAKDFAVRQALKFLDKRWYRKPTSWKDMANNAMGSHRGWTDHVFTEKDLQQSGLEFTDIPVKQLGDLYYEQDYHTEDGLPVPYERFATTPRQTIFFVKVPRYGMFLVNTEGNDYIRYALKSNLSRAKFG